MDIREAEMTLSEFLDSLRASSSHQHPILVLGHLNQNIPFLLS